MEAWKLLFSSDIGLMSLATIVLVIGMGVFFKRFISRKIDEETGPVRR